LDRCSVAATVKPPLARFVLRRAVRKFVPVEEETNETASYQTGEHCQWEGSGRQSKTNTTNVNHSLEALAEDCDKREDEHGILCRPRFEASHETNRPGRRLLGFHGFGQLDLPFVLEFIDTQECRAHQGNDDYSNNTEDSFPYVLGIGEKVLVKGVKGTYHASTDAETDEEAGSYSEPYLSRTLSMIAGLNHIVAERAGKTYLLD
jgi:hypothetical protein